MKASTKNENLPHKLVEGSFREAAILSGDILLVPRAALCRDAPDSLQHLFLCEKKNVCIHFCIHFYMYTHTNMNMYTYTNMNTYIHFLIHLLQHLLLSGKKKKIEKTACIDMRPTRFSITSYVKIKN